jgi:tRNA/tmRNA/rRNA uracil-C5-methylase (TrmA/RlmC/RlmD family)
VSTDDVSTDDARGTRIELEVGAVAHGGHCVARYEGRVVFVRHALPGERVRAEVTDGGPDASFWRADAVEVLEASPHRVEPPCPWAGPGRCGGCDWQHADLPTQRALKADVVREQLQRLGGVEVDVEVEAVPVPGHDVDDGLRWRTRVHYAVDRSARAGLRAHRSHRVVPVDVCRIATTEVAEVPVTAARWPGVSSVEVAASAGGERAVVVEAAGRRRPAVPDLPDGTSVVVTREGSDPERVRGRTWLSETVELPDGPGAFRVGVSGFWQVHPGAGAALAAAVVEAADPRPGEQALDLYSGVGLLTLPLATRVGPTGSVVSVESDARAVRDARRNLHDHPQVRIEQGRTERVLGALAGELGGADVVVLDPPRSGAGRGVVDQLVALAPRVVVYVACDPAALGRDVRLLAERGYRLDGLRAFDLFPMTHHVECVARFVPD